MFCSNCGAETHEFSEICSRCKTPLTVPVATTHTDEPKNMNLLVLGGIVAIFSPLAGLVYGIYLCLWDERADQGRLVIYWSVFLWLLNWSFFNVILPLVD